MKWSRKATVETITAVLVFLFLYTGLSKYASYMQFVNALHNSPILKRWANPIAFALPGIEIITAIILTLPCIRMKGLYISAALLSIFTGYLLYMLLSATRLPCTCGGIISKLTWPQHTVLNVMLLISTMFAIVLSRKPASHQF